MKQDEYNVVHHIYVRTAGTNDKVMYLSLLIQLDVHEAVAYSSLGYMWLLRHLDFFSRRCMREPVCTTTIRTTSGAWEICSRSCGQRSYLGMAYYCLSTQITTSMIIGVH
jgi:hypothetical protein